MSNQKLSPENYIIKKARTLPIVDVLINNNWESACIATIFVVRQHTQGNYTVGVYMVDLLCLGVKDTFFIFNKDEDYYQDFLLKMTNSNKHSKIDYNMAHNIIFEAIDFADAIKIKPHKDFKITKFILEDEDNEDIPYIEIACGDKNDGKPHLFVTEVSPEYSRFLPHLEKYVGKGNFHFTIGADAIDSYKDDDDDVSDDDLDEDDDDLTEEVIGFMDKIKDLPSFMVIDITKKCILDLIEKYKTDVRDFSNDKPKMDLKSFSKIKIDCDEDEFFEENNFELLDELIDGKYDEVQKNNLEKLKSLINAHPNNPHFRSEYLELHYKRTNNTDETLDLLLEYEKLFPNHLPFVNMKALLIKKTGKAEEAYQYLCNINLCDYTDKKNKIYNLYLAEYYHTSCSISLILNDMATFKNIFNVFDSITNITDSMIAQYYLRLIQLLDLVITSHIGENNFTRQLFTKYLESEN